MLKSTLILLVFVTLLSLVTACHFSCICKPGTNVCNSCKVPGSAFDQYQRSCPCPSGYFTDTLEPFVCTKYLYLDANNTDISIVLSACEIETSRKASSLQILTNSTFAVINGVSSILAKISVDTSSVSLLPECIQNYSSQLKYNNTQTKLFEDLPAKYVKSNINGTVSVQFPLIDIYQLSYNSTVNVDNQIQQTINFFLLVSNQGGVIRRANFDLIVLTNRNQVETFTFDVGLQASKGCSIGQDCVVVADLSTTGVVCETNACNVTRSNLTYTVGDTFTAKIFFTDPTYTKALEFISLFLRDDKNIVYNFSGITTAIWRDNSLIISLPLVEPSISATIQVNMQILNQSVLRRSLSELINAQSRSVFEATINPLPDQQIIGSNHGSILLVAYIAGLISLLLLA